MMADEKNVERDNEDRVSNHIDQLSRCEKDSNQHFTIKTNRNHTLNQANAQENNILAKTSSAQEQPGYTSSSIMTQDNDRIKDGTDNDERDDEDSKNKGDNYDSSGDDVDDEDDDGVPYDKGWAWMVALGTFVLYFVYVSYGQLIAVLLLDLLQEFDISVSIITVMLSLTNVVYCIATQTSATILVPRFSNRSVDTCAALVNALSTLTFVAAPNIAVLFIVSLLKYITKGLTLISTMTLVGFYFRKRRALATALSLTGTSVSVIAAPPMVRYLRDEYGLRGCFLLFAGFELHAVIASLLLRPLTSYKKTRGKEKPNKEKNEQQLDLKLVKPKENCSPPKDTNVVPVLNGHRPVTPPVIRISESSATDNDADKEIQVSSQSGTVCPSLPEALEVSETLPKYPDSSQPLLTQQKAHKSCGQNKADTEDFDKEMLAETSLTAYQSSGTDQANNPESINDLKEKSFSDNKHDDEGVENDSNNSTERKVAEEEEPLLRKCVLTNGLSNENTGKLTQDSGSELSIPHQLNKLDSMPSAIIGSTLSIGSPFAPEVKNNSTAATRKFQKVFGICSCMSIWLDTSLLKNLLCIMVVLVYALSNAGLFTNIYLPSYATKVGVSPQNSAILLTISGVLDLFGRTLMGYFVDLKLLRPGTVLAVTAVCLGVVNSLAGLYDGFEALVFFSVMTGFFGAGGQTTLTVLIVDTLGLEHLATVMALSSGCLSIFLVIQHPIQGALIELTGSFVATFVYVGVSYFLAASLLVSEPIIRRWQSARERKDCHSLPVRVISEHK